MEYKSKLNGWKPPNNNITANRGRRPRLVGTAPITIPGPVAQRVGATGTNASVGTLRVHNKEYWGTLTVGASAGISTLIFSPGKSGMTVLDGIGAVYNHYKVHKAVVTIIGTAPTTSKTVANICLDYKLSNLATTQNEVLRTVPNLTVPAYRTGKLVGDTESMQQCREWMISNGATPSEQTAAVVLTSWLKGDKDDAYNVYCDYDVEFRNPAKRS